MAAQDSFHTRSTLKIKDREYRFYSLKKLKATQKQVATLPFSLKILLENLLRHEDGNSVKAADIEALCNWDPKSKPDTEIQFMPARILLQDFTGVPAVCDLAAMRGAVKRLGGDPSSINPMQPADLVIDHSVQVDYFGTPDAAKKNSEIEFERNRERYEFLKWGQTAFKNFSVVPPNTGIVHQVNLEYLSQVAFSSSKAGADWLYPDTLVGTDSHTTMINGLGVLGWGVGGIEAEAAMLGQSISMLIPNVVGFKMTGKMKPGMTATDLVLVVTQMLRKRGVVGKFVEFFGPGLANLTLADRATISNMCPEYGATAAIFPIDEQTTNYLELTARPELVSRVKAYYTEQEMWYSADAPQPRYSEVMELDLAKVEPSLAGPSRPQDRIELSRVGGSFQESLPHLLSKDQSEVNPSKKASVTDEKGRTFELTHGSVVIAAITSCTNTSNPSVLIAAGLLAKNANAKGLTVKPWVKTSLAPGSKVVTDYLVESGLMSELEKLNYYLVGYGCTTCIGNSGPLSDPITDGIKKENLAVASVLSGNRNFEGRISPHVRANYLASPPLVVAYSIAGNVNINLEKDPLGKDKDGKDVFLKDIWPADEEIQRIVTQTVTSQKFAKDYADVFKGDEQWQNVNVTGGELYQWDDSSTYIKEPPFFQKMTTEAPKVEDIKSARVLVMLGDSVTTDHISPAGSIPADGPAGKYLSAKGIEKRLFNSFGARRGNHEVMLRGTFGNVRLRNRLAPGTEGGITRYLPTNDQMSIFDASMKYQNEGIPLVVLAGKEYGTGSSRDWAAKGSDLLGIRAVIAQSFERIHRSNLIGMGILPLQFEEGESYETLGLTGEETFDIKGLSAIQPSTTIEVTASGNKGSKSFKVLARVDTPNEVEYFKNGGILQYVLRQNLKK